MKRLAEVTAVRQAGLRPGHLRPRLVGDRGAALITVLLFIVVIFILITAMLATTGNEIVIARLHRDGARQLQLAEAGIREAKQRIQNGRAFASFTSSLNPGVTVAVVRRVVGTNSAYMEIQSTATGGGVTRRLSALVVQVGTQSPSNAIFSSAVTEGENIRSGDIYSQTYVNYSSPLSDPVNTITYAGWRIKETAGVGLWTGPCYTHAQCVPLSPRAANWYPATRRTEYASSGLGTDILNQTKKCPAGGGGPLPADNSGPTPVVLATDPCSPSCTPVTNYPLYGFDTDDPGTGPLAVTAALPCGLPYKYVLYTFPDETGTPGTQRLMKTIVFDQWLANYWTYDTSKMISVKTAALANNKQFGAVPPSLTINTDPTVYDRVLTGGGTITGDLGTCNLTTTTPPCTDATDRPISILLTGGNWIFPGVPVTGHGTLVVNGNLTLNGTVTWYGQIIVNGYFETGIGVPTHQIFGGVSSSQPLLVHDTTQVYAGGSMASVPIGRSTTTGKAWWER